MLHWPLAVQLGYTWTLVLCVCVRKCVCVCVCVCVCLSVAHPTAVLGLKPEKSPARVQHVLPVKSLSDKWALLLSQLYCKSVAGFFLPSLFLVHLPFILSIFGCVL